MVRVRSIVTIISFGCVVSTSLFGAESLQGPSIVPSQDERGFIGENFKTINFTEMSLTDKCLKSSDFSDVDLRDINIEGSDFYNAHFSHTLLSPEQEKLIQHSFPLFEYRGRITEINDNGSIVRMEELNRSDLNDYVEKARKDDPIALFKAAYLYETYGTKDDEMRAFLYYNRAFELGMSEAGNNLGWMYENGRGRGNGSFLDSNLVYEEYYAPFQHKHPVIRFNALRCRAMYQNDAEAQCELAHLMSQQPDHFSYTLVNSWFKRAFENGNGEAAYQLAQRYRDGKGVLISINNTILWSQRAVALDHVKACRDLATLLLWNDAVWPDIKGAFDHYLSAAQLDDEGSQKRLAFFYAVCFGGTLSPKKALFWYTQAARRGSISAIFNAARLTEQLDPTLEGYKRSSEGYEEVLRAAPDHAGALLNLARFYQYEWGVASDPERIERMIVLAAEYGHMAATLKYSSMQEFLPPPMMEYHSLDQIYARVELLGNLRRAEIEERSASSTPEHQAILTEAKGISMRFQEEDETLPIHINYEALMCDPYSKDYLISYDDISEEMIHSDYLEGISQALYSAYEDPFYKKNAFYDKRHLIFIREHLNSLQQSDSYLKKMFVWWYNHATDSKYLAKDPALFGYKDDKHILMARGGLLSRLISRVATFIDEDTWYEKEVSARFFAEILERFLETENWHIAYQQERSGEFPLALKISKVIHSYKHHFLKLHEMPTEKEDVHNGSSSVYDALRLSLGLTQGVMPLKNARQSSMLTTALTSFMRGGVVYSNEQTAVTIPPLTPTFLVSLLQKSLYNPQDLNLTTNDLETFMGCDELLFTQYRNTSLSNSSNNEYFDPFAEDLRPAAVGSEARLACYKPKVFEYLLKTYGYLIESKKQ